jgi:hypothetical protein
MKSRNSQVRVSSIGKTFMDMTRRPDYCGGEEHVLESFIEHGKKYAPLIIKLIGLVVTLTRQELDLFLIKS